jgi:peptide/nickel transport system permease protein
MMRQLQTQLRIAWTLRIAVVGLALVGAVVLLTVWGLLTLPHDPFRVNLQDRLIPPSWQPGGDERYVLGTDQLGRDLFSRIVYAGRWSLVVGVLATLMAAMIGTSLGVLAGYYGGWVDALVTFIVNWMIAFPFIVLALVAIAVLGPSFWNVVLVLGAVGWTTYGRVVRTETLSLRDREFVQAARVVGASTRRIIVQHVLRNEVDSILVLLSLQVAAMILAESFLSFIGFGIQPPIPSWGNMLADARGQMGTSWWLAAFPGSALFVTSLGINLLGDGLRDLLDPRARWRSTSKVRA